MAILVALNVQENQNWQPLNLPKTQKIWRRACKIKAWDFF